MSASVSGTTFAIILGFIFPNLFGDISNSSIHEYFFSSISIIPFYMIYSFPAILIYGVITSIISDKVGDFISIKTKEKKVELIVSGVLHMVFGLILFWLSLGAAMLFFITDRIMKRREQQYKWLEAIKSLAIPVVTWLIFMGIVWVNDMFLN
jgi:membrane-bound ClpP family serine protease